MEHEVVQQLAEAWRVARALWTYLKVMHWVARKAERMSTGGSALVRMNAISYEFPEKVIVRCPRCKGTNLVGKAKTPPRLAEGASPRLRCQDCGWGGPLP